MRAIGIERAGLGDISDEIDVVDNQSDVAAFLMAMRLVKWVVVLTKET